MLQRFANQEAAIRESLRELPSTLRETNGALVSSNKLALASLPALRDSLPGARALDAGAAGSCVPSCPRPWRRSATRSGPSPNNFVATKHLRQALDGLGKTTPPLKTGFNRLNELPQRPRRSTPPAATRATSSTSPG